MKAVEEKLAEQDTSEKVTADETADVDRTEEVSKSENTIAEEEVNDGFCFHGTTEGLTNHSATSSTTSIVERNKRNPTFYTIQLDDRDMLDSD